MGGLIPSFRLLLLPLSHIRNINPNLFTDGSFDYEASLMGFDDWDYDDVDGKAKAGCAYTVADGNSHILKSNPIEANPGDRFDVEVYTRWLSLTSIAGSIQLAMSAYDASKTKISTTVLASTSGTGTIVGWNTSFGVGVGTARQHRLRGDGTDRRHRGQRGRGESLTTPPSARWAPSRSRSCRPRRRSRRRRRTSRGSSTPSAARPGRSWLTWLNGSRT